ncbi:MULTISPECIES: uracil-DNA glycosylase [Moraxella]|jgi:uracil-DNA glycosylase|uniref:Uracil-DNA glycosylase n=1 Tax=Moraxella lacunata TaxID=477 RepID=A0A1B8Q1U6_MORLA|nr:MULTISPECIES: uracil-DNA glycosylase [Moraxella]MBE9579422.1 uracil-DNA glycosylase [Moraxella sp. K1664]MBE9588769.1 uracil-DNA glycosylase [Moraxella sp. K1630]MBE9596991.1 uracil-DNA glycosylase [Moraxella sp. K2450]MDH9219560.1 uracil-DNA glycosylase [Moraxella lacunata]MDI4483484.1 uracil-DNA glycosylase [Moraxella lacunata]
MNTNLTQDQLTALNKVQLPNDWKFALADILLSPVMDNLRAFLQNEYAQGKTIYPPKPLIFNALNTTPLSAVKVVILGQDPYHGAGQAMGLSFSVPKIIPKPPSLANILKELATDLGIPVSAHGDLTHWANQGVLLLNATLTVENGQAGSHQGKGWEEFTDAIIDVINRQTDRTVFILWGSYAKKKGRFIDTSRHLILTANHPSPLSANRGGFFGSRPFSQTNDYLVRHGKGAIDWALPQ